MAWLSFIELDKAVVRLIRLASKVVGVVRGHEREDTLKPNHRQLVYLTTWTTALSNSMKVSHAMWGHPRWVGHGGEV